ncbi:MAG TPA: short-chain dehydrogenase [Cryomorphaceae bacterium]|nr:short-chain dehydrogenase [Owenweeksia sp.]MBF99275.1 short-chain dehydrogenase [Owenweeksia sp.]HAD96714.1 short-chain dehydrogenase [Cryomorphaceae bacterium]HBF21431.1 short-chain dehydrogenase [Cryomorphaceae bacterium]HCQ14981.1 short-chain dehydrogenase [Cryomorphaceae bacterium]|tara:strand:- start:9678 stop:10466 length:789 start_codon:yes stop_codon:yes gene_type:complete
MDLNLSGKKALVCGSSDGIGKAAAMELARMGAAVTLLARNEEKLEAVRKELPTPSGQKHDFLVADFDDPINLESVIFSYIGRNKPFSILVNNTGGPPAGKAYQAEVEAYVSAFKRHLVCNQVLVKLLWKGMEEEGYGRIINVISTSVKAPLPNLGVSNTVRGAVANWSKTLANELGEFGITVNNVLPGATETGRLTSIIENKAGKTGRSPEEVGGAMKGQIPLKRFAQPEEVANAIAFLASPAAAYISGVNIPVDGGRTPNL